VTDPSPQINQTRRALLARNTETLAEVAAQWWPVAQRIDQEIAQLLAQAPSSLPATWLYERSRLEGLRLVVQLITTHYTTWLRGALTTAQALAALQATQDAQALLTALGVSAPQVAAVAQLPLTMALEQLLQSLPPQTARAVGDALVRGVATGQGPRQIARLAREASGLTLARSLTIVRTETLRAYREATRSAYLRNQEVVSGWIWHAALSPRTCALCIAMHGTRHPLSEPLTSHPNCRCAMVPIVPGVTIASGADWFAGQPAATQRAILGPAKLRAYQAGDLQLADLVGETRSATWGAGRYEKSLKELAA
jgi:SPP1 gp7 family putative phage head morphogenesis protein